MVPLSSRAVRIDDSPEASDWCDFMANCVPSPLWYAAEWERVWGQYGLSSYRLLAWQGGSVVGGVRLVLQRSWVTGTQLVALPWFDAAGIVAEDQDVRTALVDGALKLAQRLNVKRVQLRQASADGLSPHVREDKVLVRLALEPSAARLWDRLKPKVRNQVRKGEKCGLVYETGGAELLEEFFAVYSENMRDLGSPSHSLAFFATVLEAFPDATRLHVVRAGGRAVGAGLTMANGSTLEIPWASGLKSYNGLCVNHFMYWRILAQACADGFERFHFGRSTRGSGQHHFKLQWGSEEVPLFWYVFGDDREAVHVESATSSQPGLGRRLWMRLPLWMSRRLGPKFMAHIP